MDFQNLLNYAEKAIEKLIAHWEIKLPLSGVFLMVQMHAQLFSLFTFIVFLDLFTKWVALSYEYIQNQGEKDNIQFLDAVRGIPAAHRVGIINSNAMKTQFAGKMGVYILLVIGGGAVDKILVTCGKSGEFMGLAIGYLAVTELLSIIENLDASGVSSVHGLIDLIKRRQK